MRPRAYELDCLANTGQSIIGELGHSKLSSRAGNLGNTLAYFDSKAVTKKVKFES